MCLTTVAVLGMCCGVRWVVRMLDVGWTGLVDWRRVLPLVLGYVSVGLWPSGLMFPVAFRFDAERGRILPAAVVTLVVVGLVCVFVTRDEEQTMSLLRLVTVKRSLLLFAGTSLFYAASWALAVRWYENKEL